MELVIRLYAILLRLYPRTFRDEFADEMQSVFTDAIANAAMRGRTATIAFVARELLDLPGNLWREYSSAFGKEVSMSQGNDMTQALFDQEREPGSWRNATFAGLPHLLCLVVLLFLNLLFAFALVPLEVSNMLGMIVSVMVILAMVLSVPFIWRNRTQRWVGSWYGYWLLIASIAVTIGLQTWRDANRSTAYLPNILQTAAFQLALPLSMFIFLFIVIQRDRIRGLLTVMPWLIVFWIPLLEFVPNAIRTPLEMSWGLSLAILTAMIIRWGSVQIGVWLIIAFNCLMGLAISYAQTYLIVLPPEAGTGWQTRSAIDWANYFAPTLLTTSTLIVGPLLAWAMQELGKRGEQEELWRLGSRSLACS